MRFDDEVLIDASVEKVWEIYANVARWPEWTASIRSVQYLEGDALAPGARLRIEQPKLPAAVWQIIAVNPGHSWTWVARGPGIRTTAIHSLEADGPKRTRAHQTLIQSGPLGAIFGRFYARLTRRYLAMEGAGLRQRCEAHASESP